MNNFHAQYEQLDIPFMGCHFFAHVTQGENHDFVGDYLLLDENDAWYFCQCVRNRGLDFAINEYGAHKMSESDWSQYDSMILAIAR